MIRTSPLSPQHSDNIIQNRKLLKCIVTRTKKYNSHTDWSAHGFKLLLPIFKSLRKISSMPKLLKYTKQVYDTFPCNYKVHKLNEEHSETCSTCTADVIETPEHVLYCPTSTRKCVRNHLLSSIDAWIENTRMNAHTQTHLRKLSQILRAQQYDIPRRGIWTGRPHIEIVSRCQKYVKLNFQNQDISLNCKVIVTFHTKLIKASHLFWRLRCFEVNATKSQQQKLNKLRNANDVLEYMRDSQQITGKCQHKYTLKDYYKKTLKGTQKHKRCRREGNPQTPLSANQLCTPTRRKRCIEEISSTQSSIKSFFSSIRSQNSTPQNIHQPDITYLKRKFDSFIDDDVTPSSNPSQIHV
jgi:hypothetical protein